MTANATLKKRVGFINGMSRYVISKLNDFV